MVNISDRHREEIIRILDLFEIECKNCDNTKVRDAVRRAKLLRRDLSKKKSFSPRKEKILKNYTLF